MVAFTHTDPVYIASASLALELHEQPLERPRNLYANRYGVRLLHVATRRLRTLTR
jgi:hypothetical protein